MMMMIMMMNLFLKATTEMIAHTFIYSSFESRNNHRLRTISIMLYAAVHQSNLHSFYRFLSSCLLINPSAVDLKDHDDGHDFPTPHSVEI